ncbi:MAG: glycosyltransferase family 2 protein [Candidatus Devosia phytovorans]|uniref:Glycosyltransferase family 2 protein n=1 Tax=Candidatus Devosia phytovorans TaxID=3121372 RepID=A0AAJ5VST3_9HYPH|nr:glycosyltransferase family 2 protein [Devosia sp.]WEK03642.1 MAG: glycosyltransferase family 2 protein [Devosia sp.]
MAFPDPCFVSLSARVVLAVWSPAVPIEGQSTLTGSFGEVITPLSGLRVPQTDGGTRLVFALRRTDEDTTFMLAAGGLGSTPVAYSRETAKPISDTIFDGLTPAGRMSLANALVSAWPNLFHLQRDKGFIATLRRLLPAPEGDAARVVPLLGAGRALVFETQVPRQFGPVKSGYIVDGDAIIPLKLKSLAATPTGDRANTRRFFVDTPEAGEGLLVLRGTKGMLLRRWSSAAAPSAEAWWRKQGHREPGLREECIALLNAHSPAARAASVEFQLRCPLKPAAVNGGPMLPGAQIELALAGKSGMLFSGWYRDPSDFIEGFDVLGPNDTPISLDAVTVTFPGQIANAEGKPTAATGLLGFVPAVTGPLLQPRFLMRLKSGVRHLLTPAVQQLDWPAARAAALRSVLPQALNDHIISTCLAPIITEFQDAAKATVGAAEIRQFGAPVDDPLVSIIIPLYKVLEFLPFQIAAFASDPQIAYRCEVIFVLDSPEQAAVVEHMLTGLHLVYGMPMTLAVMPRNGGYAIANNRGAAHARGAALVLLNSDVIPTENGWVGELIRRLNDPSIGAVGPKLLFEDDSIQHAGLYFHRDHRGRWLNHHYYKGMPRHYRPAGEERLVPGVTGACVVTRRDIFEKVGGFTEDYVIGDYEDSDLCLKIRAAGFEIAYVPSAELYHLERRSISSSSDYMQGVASQYNSWLHEQRWSDAMAELMAEAVTPAAQPRRVA